MTSTRQLRFQGLRGVLALALLLSCGCQEMTKKRLELLMKEQQSALDKLNDEYERLGAGERARIELESKAAERASNLSKAQARLLSGDAKGALAEIDALLAVLDKLDEAARGGAKDAPKPEAKPKDAGPVASVDPKERSACLLVRGDALAQLGRSPEAMEVYLDVLRIAPEERSARRSLGKIHLQSKHYRQALETLQPELAAGWRDAALLEMVGTARYELGISEDALPDLNAARIAFQEVLIERPGESSILLRLARIEHAMGQDAEAVRYLNLARRENPLEPEYLELLGESYLALGNEALAADYLELAAGWKTVRPETCLAIARVQQRRGLPARAAEWMAMAYEDSPSRAPAGERLDVGKLFFDGGREEDAVSWLQAIRPADSGYGVAQAMLSRIHARAGRIDEALEAYAAARKTGSDDGRAHLAAGEIHLRGRDLEKAADAFSQASTTEATRVDGLRGLAEVYLAKSDLPSALQYLKKALELRPGDAILAETIQQIEREEHGISRGGQGLARQAGNP